MTIDVSAERVIPLPPEQVAGYAMDWRHDAEWSQGIRTAELTREADGGGLGVGAEITRTAYFLGRRIDTGSSGVRRTVMAYDEGLAERIRDRLGADPDITEKRTFGGLAFLHRGNMAVGVSGDDLMVRVGPDNADAALARPGTRVFDMTGRPMRGWILVDGTALTEDDVLGRWIDEGRAFAASLPPK
ncbi:TfoX/Sxy family protein [Streptomyces ureilyticus]|nr:TfoX/Sxy family protein [Streptomyces ureilyticus]